MFVRQKVAVFVDGDFWHGRVLVEHGLDALQARLRTSSQEYWLAKLQRNVQRDRDAAAALTARGWLVLRMWESDVKKDTQGAAATIAARSRQKIVSDSSGRVNRATAISGVPDLSAFIGRVPDPQHRAALEWFAAMRGRMVEWASISLPGVRLRSTPKGIYKPKGADYALSVRVLIRSPYTDVGPVYRPSGTWVYKYHEEAEDQPHAGMRSLYTNRALVASMALSSPVGVLKQATDTRAGCQYRVYGIGPVVGYRDGYFYLEGFSSKGKVNIAAEGADLDAAENELGIAVGHETEKPTTLRMPRSD